MSYTNHSLPYNQDDMEFTQPQYPDFNHYPSDRLADSAAEGRILYPSQLHPHPLFTRQGNTAHSIIQNRSLEPHILNPHHSVYHPFTNHSTQLQHHHTTPQNNWPPYDHPISPQNYSYPPYPSPSPFPPPRLSPPPSVPIHFKSCQNNSPTSSQNQNQRLTLAGSLDPSTGIFYRTPEHPRLRTAQACEKCRTRKAKCSGEHPTCKRCLTRGLVCEYAKEGRVRGPNKTKSKQSNSGNDTSSNTANTRNCHTRMGPRGRPSSANSSGSSDHIDPPGEKVKGISHTQTGHLMALGLPYNVSPLPSPSMSEEFMYPPSNSYLQQHQSFPQYHVGNGSRNAIDGTTSGSSPHTSVSGGTSSVNSPLSPASAPPFVISPSVSRINMKMDLDVDHTLRGQRSGLGGGSGSVPIEPVWIPIDHLGQVNAYPQLNSNSDQGNDERVQNGFLDGNRHQNEALERNLFMKNGQGRPNSQQDHFHGQPQSRNETQHYPAPDLQRC